MTGCWSEGGGATGGGTGGEDGGLVPGTVAAGPGFYAGAGSDSYMTVHFEEASVSFPLLVLEETLPQFH